MKDFIIEWDINPEIIKVFDVFPIRYYSLLFVLGLIISYYLLKKVYKTQNIDSSELEKLVIYVFTGTILGARLGHCLFYDFSYYFYHVVEIFLPIRKNTNGNWFLSGFQGLASHGGAIGILISLFIFSLKNKIRFSCLVDRVSLVAPIAAAFIRLGNFMNSEIIGKPTNSDFGVIFLQVDKLPRHPTQIYEAFIYLISFFILQKFYKSSFNKKCGQTFGLLLILIFTSRFIIEFFKINQVSFEKNLFLNMGQSLSIPFILIGLYLIIFKKHRS